MILNFKYGFYINSQPYGWLNKELYRLPYINESKMSFPLKKLEQIIIGNNVGYRVGGKKKTIQQLELITNNINVRYNSIKDADCPF